MSQIKRKADYPFTRSQDRMQEAKGENISGVNCTVNGVSLEEFDVVFVMEPDMNFNFDINLKCMSLIAIGRIVWESPKIQEDMDKFFFSECKPQMYDTFKTIVLKVLDHSDQITFNLPLSIQSEIQQELVFMGEKIYEWLHYAECELLVKYYFGQCVRKLCWTHNGTIDEKKIYELDLLSRDIDAKYILSCIYGNEKFLLDNKKETDNEKILNFCYENDIYDTISKNLFKWVCRKKNRHNTFLQVNQRIPPEDMFKFCLSVPYIHAAKYFWNLLDDVTKLSLIPFSSKLCAEKIATKRNDRFSKQWMDVFVFVMEIMSPKERISFVSDNIVNVLIKFLRVSPYQEFFLPAVKRFWNLIPEVELKGIMHEIINCIKWYDSYGEIPGAKKRFVQLFCSMWLLLSKNLKEEWVRSFFSSAGIFDVSCMKLMINDPDLENQKEKLITMNIKNYSKSMMDGKLKLLDQYYAEVLSSEMEHKIFSKEVNILGLIISAGDFDLAEKAINWLPKYVNRNKQEIMKRLRINKTDLIGDFLGRQKSTKKADNFLNWYFDTPEERENMRKDFGYSKHFRYQFYKIWVQSGFGPDDYDSDYDPNDFRNQATEYVKWCCQTEEEMAWRKRCLLLSEHHLEELCCYIHQEGIPDSFPTVMSELIEFCAPSPETIAEIKQRMIKRINRFMDTFIYQLDAIVIVDDVINWLFGKEEDRKSVIRKYLNKEDNGFYICRKFCNNWLKPSEKEIKVFNSWMKLVDISDAENKLQPENIVGNLKEMDINHIRSIFEKIKQNLTLTWEDVSFSKWITRNQKDQKPDDANDQEFNEESDNADSISSGNEDDADDEGDDADDEGNEEGADDDESNDDDEETDHNDDFFI